MWRLRYAIKPAIAHALFRLGILGLLRARRLRGRAVVLMYHRVLPADVRRRTGSHPGYIVSDTTFARQMAYLKRHFTVLSEQEFVAHLDAGRPFPEGACLITFDDGWRDNLEHALPVLRAQGLPAVVYLPVNFIGTRRVFWREALTAVLVTAVGRARSDARLRTELDALLGPVGLSGVLSITDRDPREAVIAAVDAQSHRRMQDDGALLRQLEQRLGIDVEASDTPDGFLSWPEVREMTAAGISFGAHGAEHRLLGELPVDDAEVELRESKRIVAEQLGRPVLGLSYPNGSVTPAVRALADAAGYRVAFTTRPGAVAPTDDRLMLARVNVHEDMTRSVPMFMARVVGLW